MSSVPVPLTMNMCWAVALCLVRQHEPLTDNRRRQVTCRQRGQRAATPGHVRRQDIGAADEAVVATQGTEEHGSNARLMRGGIWGQGEEKCAIDPQDPDRGAPRKTGREIAICSEVS